VQNQHARPRTGRDRVGATLIIAELHEERLLVKLLYNRAYLPACKPLRGKVNEQRDHVQKSWSHVFERFFAFITAPSR
jgi:hypothetical protein